MNHKTFLILGGYGNVGRIVAELLLQETNLCLVIAGRNLAKAQAAAAHFNHLFGGNRVESRWADAADVTSLRQVLSGVDLVVVASSTAQYTKEVATTALDAGCDYLDIHFGPQVYATLQPFAEVIKNAGRCFISGGGFHPGVPAALMRYAGQYFDQMDQAIVGSVMKVNFRHYQISESTRIEFVEQVVDTPLLFYKDREWRKVNMMSAKDFRAIDFGGEFGRQQCVPMYLEELRALPVLFPDLNETGFYIAGFNCNRLDLI